MTSTQDRIDALWSDGSDDRSDGGERPPWRRLSRRATVLIAVVVVVVLALVATWVVAFSPLLGVRSVQVRGLRSLSSAQVRRAADIPDGTPLVRVDTAAATARVERLPEVRSAQVSTSLPSTVVITVEQRVPVGYLRHGGVDHLVDSTGVQFRSTAHAPFRLPLLVTGGSRSATRGVAVVAAGLPRPLLARVRSVQALDARAITLLLTDSRIVQWGTSAHSRAKGRVLQVLLHLHHSRYATVFDVSDPDQPFTH